MANTKKAGRYTGTYAAKARDNLLRRAAKRHGLHAMKSYRRDKSAPDYGLWLLYDRANGHVVFGPASYGTTCAYLTLNLSLIADPKDPEQAEQERKERQTGSRTWAFRPFPWHPPRS